MVEEAGVEVEVEREWIPPLVDQFCPPCSVILVTASLQRKIERHTFRNYSIIIHSTSAPRQIKKKKEEKKLNPA